MPPSTEHRSPPPEEAQAFRPIFVVGSERSGTTLLAALLDRHTCIAATPETHFWRTLSCHRARAPMRSREDAVDLALSLERVRDLALEREDVLPRMLAHPPDMAHAFQALLEAYAGRHGKPLCAEKTPAHLFRGTALLGTYPSGRLIWLVRDGRDVVLSLMKAPWTDANPLRHAVAWREAAATGLALERRFPTRVSRLRFEDLIERPREELTRVMRFLGLDFEERQLDPEAPTYVVPAWEAAWKHKAAGPLDAARISVWKREADGDLLKTVSAIIEPSLRRLGYPPTPVETDSMAALVGRSVLAAWSRVVYGRRLNPMLARIHAFVRAGGHADD